MLLVKFIIISNLVINDNFINFGLVLSKLNNVSISNVSKISNDRKIGIVDFREILRRSNAMKNLGAIFIDTKKKLNNKLNVKQVELKKKEKIIIQNKKKLSNVEYQKRIKEFKASEVKSISLSLNMKIFSLRITILIFFFMEISFIIFARMFLSRF